MGITILNAANINNADPNNPISDTAGAAVQVSLINSATGTEVLAYADQVGASTSLFHFTPAAALADGVYFVRAAVRIFDDSPMAPAVSPSTTGPNIPFRCGSPSTPRYPRPTMVSRSTCWMPATAG